MIKDFLLHPGFPVDIRHNAKINREQLAQWAQKNSPNKTTRTIATGNTMLKNHQVTKHTKLNAIIPEIARFSPPLNF